VAQNEISCTLCRQETAAQHSEKYPQTKLLKFISILAAQSNLSCLLLPFAVYPPTTPNERASLQAELISQQLRVISVHMTAGLQ